MVVFSASRRPLVALALLSSAFAVSVSPASARSHHGSYRYAHARYAYRHVPRRFAQQSLAQPEFFGQSNYSQVASYPRVAYRPISGEALIELPVTIAHFLGREVTAGGGFFRLLPGRITGSAVRAANRDANRSSTCDVR